MYCPAVISTLMALASLSVSQTINPDSVDLGTRQKWCTSQTAQCPLLCTQYQQGSMATAQNTCDPTTLNYQCVCDNMITPNVSQYSLTMPYYECTTAADQCVTNCAQADNTCKGNCRTAHPCGAQNPVRVNVTSTSSSSMSSTAAPTSSSTGASAASSGGLINGPGSAGGKMSAASALTVQYGQYAGAAALFLGSLVGAMALA